MEKHSASMYRFKPEEPERYKFCPPPEAPVFEPSNKEFESPLEYIDSIKEIAEKYGIIKIRPPPEWQPPFAIDIQGFRFKTRIQQLNELEARTRIKLNFLSKIRKFWELQGRKLRQPVINKQRLDLYLLYHLVKKEGGYEACKLDMKWVKIATRMNFSALVAHIIAGHYEQILYPFAIFEENNLKKEETERNVCKPGQEDIEKCSTLPQKEEIERNVCKPEHEANEKCSTLPQKQPVGKVYVPVKKLITQPLHQESLQPIKSGNLSLLCNSSSQKASHTVTSRPMVVSLKALPGCSSSIFQKETGSISPSHNLFISNSSSTSQKETERISPNHKVLISISPSTSQKKVPNMTPNQKLYTSFIKKETGIISPSHNLLISNSLSTSQKQSPNMLPNQKLYASFIKKETGSITPSHNLRISNFPSTSQKQAPIMAPNQKLYTSFVKKDTGIISPSHNLFISNSPSTSQKQAPNLPPNQKLYASFIKKETGSITPNHNLLINNSPSTSQKQAPNMPQNQKLYTSFIKKETGCISPSHSLRLSNSPSTSQKQVPNMLPNQKLYTSYIKKEIGSTPPNRNLLISNSPSTSQKHAVNISHHQKLYIASTSQKQAHNIQPNHTVYVRGASLLNLPAASAPCTFGEKRMANENNLENKIKKMKGAGGVSTYVTNINVEYDPLAKYVCKFCNDGDDEECMLLCDGCDDSYHTFCLKPPLLEVPKGDWKCPVCIEQDFKMPNELFGFVTSESECSLMEFGDKAERFKTKHFAKYSKQFDSDCPIPEDVVENEYWRILSDTYSKVTVEYGADLHSIDHNGSGFPSERNNRAFRDPETPKYLVSPWNLNNLPILKGSLLGYISEEIPGMKVPWMYVGMCFSTFCWHIEDHWSYSINYLHWGDAKTWYGVPGSKATDFERVMRLAAPELFEEQPDLLHQLTTIINPNVLMAEGLPVFRTDQQAGEFVVTFPRAYHAGFNQGYNFAEAVNFAPLDWLPAGRECIKHYSLMKRYNVFSQDELLVKIAHMINCIDNKTAAAVYNDFVDMVNDEVEGRRAAYNWGLFLVEEFEFEALPDDARQCFYCNTLIYLGAVVCQCQATKNKISCLRHFRQLCDCLPHRHILRYRWNMIDLPNMGLALKDKAFSQSM